MPNTLALKRGAHTNEKLLLTSNYAILAQPQKSVMPQHCMLLLLFTDAAKISRHYPCLHSTFLQCAPPASPTTVPSQEATLDCSQYIRPVHQASTSGQYKRPVYCYLWSVLSARASANIMPSGFPHLEMQLQGRPHGLPVPRHSSSSPYFSSSQPPGPPPLGSHDT
jgi:hypothetical protein